MTLDENRLLERCQGDRQLMVEIIRIFEESVDALFQELSSALDAGDSAGVARAAHTLKGSIGNFTETGAYLLASNLESDAKRSDLSAAPSNLKLLVAELRELRQMLHECATRQGTDAVPIASGARE